MINSSLVFSQKNFIEGFIITSERDTITGFIDFKGWKSNPKNISFLEDEESEPLSFSPKDIHAFFVDGSFYVSDSVFRTPGTRSIKNAGYDPNPKPIFESVFLRMLIGGEKKLYQYLSDRLTEHFFIQTDTIVELKYVVYFNSGEAEKVNRAMRERRFLLENNQYRVQLLHYLPGCATKDFNEKIIGVSYSQKELLKLFTDYYECQGFDYYFIDQSKRTKFRWWEVLAVIGGFLLLNELL